MSRIKSLRDVPKIHYSKQTTIKKGLITQRTIIKDTIGNEYKKMNGKLERIIALQPPQKNLEFMIYFPKQPDSLNSSIWFAIVIFLCVIFLIIINLILAHKKSTIQNTN